MIVDRIEYAAEYAAQLPHLQDALQTIRSQPDMDGGKHPFPGGYVMRQTGLTKPAEDAAYEAHRKYIDVFILAEGRETVLWNRLENMQETAAYDPEKGKQALQGCGSALEMQPGMFCVLFPSDAHSACRHTAEQTAYVKYVIKLEI
nr:YhcH/YjgK/YiaL family protein [uncultured Dysosmobacter sp.]